MNSRAPATFEGYRRNTELKDARKTKARRDVGNSALQKISPEKQIQPVDEAELESLRAMYAIAQQQLEALKAENAQAQEKIEDLEVKNDSLLNTVLELNAQNIQLTADHSNEKSRATKAEIEVMMDREYFKRKNEEYMELNKKVYSDDLTGCYNRKYYEKVIMNPESVDNNIGQGNTAMVVLDLNGLKLVNDLIGHKEGDELLKTSAEFIKGALRAGDRVIRYGGDEFVILCFMDPNKENGYFTESISGRLSSAAEELKKKLEESFDLEYPFPPYYFGISNIENKSVKSISLAFEVADSQVREQKDSRPSSREILRNQKTKQNGVA